MSDSEVGAQEQEQEQEQEQTFERKFGTRSEVWEGTAKQTRGKLQKGDLVMSRSGRIVSKRKSELAKKSYAAYGFKPRKAAPKEQQKKKVRRRKKPKKMSNSDKRQRRCGLCEDRGSTTSPRWPRRRTSRRPRFLPSTPISPRSTHTLR